MKIQVSTTSNPVSEGRLDELTARPVFGTHFTDHMFMMTWDEASGWHDARVVPHEPLPLDPATAALHYAQGAFEGLKAYRHQDDSIWLFRPERNAARMQLSAARLALPSLTTTAFMAAVDALVRVDARWVPSGAEQARSLYIRPFMFASESFLGVRPSKRVTFMVIASPAGSYFASGVRPLSLWLAEEVSRAGRGGTGAAKTGGNYASSLLAQQQAIANGCDQAVFVDAAEGRFVEELSAMNICLVHRDGHIVTPSADTILSGVTIASVVEIAAMLGHDVEARKVSVDEWKQGVESGEFVELFACGTAAGVAPVGALRFEGGEVQSPTSDRGGPVTLAIRRALIELQYGSTPDPFGWMHRVL